MRVRPAEADDFPRILRLAASRDLDYPDMENDGFFVAEDERGLQGIVGLKRHPDGLELCALGVEPAAEGRGIGRALVEALSASVSEDLFLATIIPGFFEKSGFRTVADGPDFIKEKKASGWCEGCPSDRCTVMVRQSR
jgi:N-acetylglutamate synthase-like GNAT family acetyltransferase